MFVLNLFFFNVQLMVRVCNILSTRPDDSLMFILLQDC